MGTSLTTRSVFSDQGLLLLSFGAAVLLHALWGMMPISMPAAAEEEDPPQVTAYIQALPGGWSPTLFSLPSITGFSGAMKQDRFETAPPLQSPLELTEEIRIHAAGPIDEASAPSLSLGRPTHVRSVLLPAPAVPEPASSGWRLSFPLLPDRSVRLSRLPARRPQSGSLDLSGDVQFDASGRVQSLVVHPPVPSGDPAVQEAVRALRRVRVDNSVQAGQPYRFQFRYRGEAAQ